MSASPPQRTDIISASEYSRRATVGLDPGFTPSPDSHGAGGGDVSDGPTADDTAPPNVGRRFFVNPRPSDRPANFDPPVVGPKWVKGNPVARILFGPYIAYRKMKELRRRRSGHPFTDNRIQTARYTPVSFFFLQLIIQFSKFANLYFLLISAIQAVPGWSPTGRFTTIFPLGIVVFVSMLKEAYDDFIRHRQDAVENNAPVRRLKQSSPRKPSNASRISDQNIELLESNAQLFKGAEWEEIPCKDLLVGDVLCVRDREFLPADVIVLWTTNTDGIAFIETSNLDGETNLKQRQALKETHEPLNGHMPPTQYRAMIHAESPSGDLYNFHGYLMEKQGRYPLTPSQLLLRGSTLRNTKELVGVVVYSGEETRIRMNSGAPARKAPNLEKLTNKIIATVFVCQVLLAAGMTLSNYRWYQTEDSGSRHWYLSSGNQSYVVVFMNFLILFNAFIPISLYISMEILKLFQVYFMTQDLAMYDEERDIPAKTFTSALNEELGQVQYIFSDKTGTLTENKMEFRLFSTAGRSVRHYLAPEEVYPSSVSAEDVILQLVEARRSGEPLSPQLQQTFDFLEAMALCHSVVPDPLPASNKNSSVRASLMVSPDDAAIVYQSSSADEVALVQAARDMFFTLKSRNPIGVSVNIMNSTSDIDYRLLQTIEFTSDRKRMTTIYRYPNGRIVLLCKGADNIIIERLRNSTPDPSDPEFDVHKRTMDDLADYSLQGLRTLVYAYRILDVPEYEAWAAKFEAAATAVQNREAKIAAVAEEIECNLILLGVTAIEDRLQDGVPETIEKLRRANIRVWMLTGDKTETAINIGHTCNLIKKTSEVIRITEDDAAGSKDPHAVVGLVDAAIEKFMAFQEQQLKPASGAELGTAKDHSVLVIDGRTLTKLQQADGVDPHSKKPRSKTMRRFVALAVAVDNVVCCRFSPAQKALLVSVVKDRVGWPARGGSSDPAELSDIERFLLRRRPPTWRRVLDRLLLRPLPSGVTLAIGDGANDIPMIEAAHVGVGITGREGLAASRASDYAIAKFRFLQPLLFVHGHWSYVRNSLFTVAIFYKNIAFYGCQAVFQMFTGSSGTSLFEQWTLAANNLAFTSLPVIVIGIFEKDLNRSTLMGVPELYRFGQENRGFNFQVFGRWIFQGAVQAAIAVILPAIYFGGFWTRGDDVHTSLFFPTPSQFLDPSRGDWARESFASDATTRAQESSLYAYGTVAYTISVVFCTLKILYVESHSVTLVHHASALLELAVWFAFSFVYPFTWPVFGIDTGYEVVGLPWLLAHSQPAFWALVLLGSFLGMFVIDYSLRYLTGVGRLLRAGRAGGRRPDPPVVLPPAPDSQPRAEAAQEEAAIAAAHAIGDVQWGADIGWWQVWERWHRVRSST
ncbi:hypothetical protein HK405_006880 [Cladochytrium tenue]|nr:hypothetical protein HK405_006880 [Cladochytrium tenue]